MDKKKVPISNWVKLVFVFVVVVGFALFIRRWYINSTNLEMQIPIVSEVLTNEVKLAEIYDYINENDPALIYFESSSDSDSRKLEKNLISFFHDNSLEDVVVYINLSGVDVKKFFDSFKEFYGYNGEIESVPTFIYFEEAKVDKVLTGKVNKAKVEKFFKEIGLIL